MAHDTEMSYDEGSWNCGAYLKYDVEIEKKAIIDHLWRRHYSF